MFSVEVPHKPSKVYTYSQTIYIADDGVIYYVTTPHTQTHTHTYTVYMCIYIYMCVCVCIHVYLRYLDTKFLIEDFKWI
jgi:hypothetical protein